MNVLEVHDLSVHFPVYQGIVFPHMIDTVKALEGLSFTLEASETLGVLGESGSGKSTLLRTLLMAEHHAKGSLKYWGKNPEDLSYQESKTLLQRVQIIFQDPASSLNPALTVEEIILEPLNELGYRPEKPYKEWICELIQSVGLQASDLRKFPGQFSGGQKQRIAIARALSVKPDLILADEIVSGLDVSIQNQILNLLMDLQKENGFSMLFVTHDIAVARQISRRILVLHKGILVEQGFAEDILDRPQEPYTCRLIEAAKRFSYERVMK